jgi:hypothetical protein
LLQPSILNPISNSIILPPWQYTSTQHSKDRLDLRVGMQRIGARVFSYPQTSLFLRTPIVNEIDWIIC